MVKQDTDFEKFFKTLTDDDKNQMMELVNKNQELFKENAKNKREIESLTEKLDQTDKQLTQLNVYLFASFIPQRKGIISIGEFITFLRENMKI